MGFVCSLTEFCGDGAGDCDGACDGVGILVVVGILVGVKLFGVVVIGVGACVLGSSSSSVRGRSFSDKKGTASFPTRKTVDFKSIIHWCLRSSYPSRAESLFLLDSPVL